MTAENQPLRLVVILVVLALSADAWGQPPGRPGQRPVGTPYGKGTKHLEVDGANVVGKIRSLLGTNRGPFSFPRRPGEQLVSHVESYRALGIDFIRTHDFYGPTDWYVIFPDWSADPDDPANYDFRSSDERIRPIVENGFRCFYRLGTSWKGRQTRPVNDPPGTIHDADGRVVHHADRDDARKWAKICVQTMRHYTEGWNDGYQFPIHYWEIWNEPDLASQFWTGTPEQYYVFYEEAAKALKAANPKLKVGGPACTGGLRRQYVEGFIGYCREHDVPLDFFSWHSYGGRGQFNPYQYYRDAMRVRKALDEHGFEQAENINTEWNARIQQRLFSDTPAGAAFYASTLACMLDAGVDHAFQYCGDRHPGLGLHGLRDGKPKICAYSFQAWKRLLDAPNRVAATGSDQQGYSIVAGKDADGRRVRILLSDFQSSHDAFRLHITNLPWDKETQFNVKRWLLDGEHRRLEVIEEFAGKGRELTVQRPFKSGSVCVIEILKRFPPDDTGGDGIPTDEGADDFPRQPTPRIEHRLPERRQRGNLLADLPDNFVVEQDIAYGEGPNARYQTLDIIHHKDKSRRRPAIVMIHGGAFKAGDKRSYHRDMREYAQRGYITLSINYRLSQVAHFPAAVADCKLAIRWLRANADRYGVDPERIGVTGGSSGGYLTAMVALTDASDGLEGDGPYQDQSSRVQAAVPCCGAYDWRAGRVAKLGMREDDPVHIDFLGGPPTEIPELYEKASPVVYISKGDPPLLIFHGEEDRVINVLQATAFGEALEKAGADYELVAVEGAGHGPGVMRNNDNNQRMAAFFAKHLKSDDAGETESVKSASVGCAFARSGFVDSAFGIFGAYAQEYPWFKEQMGFNNEDYWEWVDRHFQILGAHWTRSNLHLIWEVVERDIGGGYNWNIPGWAGNLTDDTITHVYNSPVGVHWLGVFEFGGRRRNPLDFPDEYAAFVRAAVERYDGDGVNDVPGGAAVKYWQAGNETHQWRRPGRTVDDYVAWVRLLRKAALQADPEAKIVLVAPTQCFKPDDFLVSVIRKLAPAHEFDAIDIHHWGKAGDWKMTALPHYRALLDELGLKDVQIWSCENGTWAGKPDREPFQTEQQQGRSLVKRYAWSRANGLDKLFWNNLMEWKHFSNRPGSIFNSMGLVSDGHNSNDPPERINTERVAYWSYKMLASKTDNGIAALAGTIKDAHDDKEIFAYDYVRNADGKHFYILWSEPGKKEIAFAVPEANYHVTNMIHDRFGKVLEEFDVKAVDGKLAVTLGKDPVLVEPAVHR